MRSANYICHAISQEECSIWSWFQVHLHQVMISPEVFFSFFQSFVFLGCYWVKRAKMAQNDKKSCLSHFISRELYMIWLSFMVHLCKRMISPGVFFFSFFFSKFLSFCVVRETKEQKIVQNDKKFCMGCLISQEPCIIWSSFIVHMCKRIISPGFFLHFLQILIVVVNSGVKGQ